MVLIMNRYELLEKLAIIGGYMGHIMVYVGMLAGCILLWYFVFVFIFQG